MFVNGYYEYTTTLETFLGWRKIFGGNWHLNQFNKMLQENKLEEFQPSVNEMNKIKWLNDFYSLWINDEGVDTVVKSVFVPTQSGQFISIERLYFDSNINNDVKAILFELDPPFKNQLMHRDISAFDDYFKDMLSRHYDTEKCANNIENKVTAILSEETVNQEKRANEVQTIFNKLTDFFLKEPQLTEIIFPKILSKRMLLSSPEETLRRMKIAEKVEQNGLDLAGLEELIHYYQKLKSSLDNSTFDNEEIKRQLQHIVTSTPEMKRYFDSMLSRSVQNVYHYLKKLTQYELPDTLEEWKIEDNQTVFFAKKNNNEIIIVIRPTDNNVIIFFGDEELEVLDSGTYELWTDNGTDQKIITLGHLLKTTEITRIPLKKL
ncbi:hypothetical protein PTI45_04731 [Paenibacillus nuruki]|uniref:Uncharacterized protein n=1 Tax=Paenibacillus nuruki TaxID=1886670 RepID=A0A1E3KWT7_9BACL|nr:hypothetical protein PTI45_04731 [Paenibacillus nuruki]